MKKFLKILGAILLLAIAAVGGLFTYLSLTEYRPKAETELTLSGTAVKTLKEGDELRVLTWNIGYGALGDNADFFMDGGKRSHSCPTRFRRSERWTADCLHFRHTLYRRQKGRVFPFLLNGRSGWQI